MPASDSLSDVFEFSVIGDGPSSLFGVLALIEQLKQREHKQVIVNWYGGVQADAIHDTANHKSGAGVNYGPELPKEVIVNVLPNEVSAFADQPNHFYDWAEAQDYPITKQTYVPRSWPGPYLAQCRAEIIHKFSDPKGKIHIRGIEAQVLDIHVINGAQPKFLLDVASGGNRAAVLTDAGIFAVGHTALDKEYPNIAGEYYTAKPSHIKPDFRASLLATLSLGHQVTIGIAGRGLGTLDFIRQIELNADFKPYLDQIHYEVITRKASRAVYWTHNNNSAKNIAAKLKFLTACNIKSIARKKANIDAKINAFDYLIDVEIFDLDKNDYTEAASLARGKSILAANKQEAELVAAAAACPELQKHIRRVLAFLYGGVTAPENIDLISQLQKSNRLNFVEGYANLAAAKQSDQSINLSIVDDSDCEISRKYNFVCNTAIYDRGVNNPLLIAARDAGILIQNDIGLFLPCGTDVVGKNWVVIGPATSLRWGLETFRDQANNVVAPLCDQLFGPVPNVQLANVLATVTQPRRVRAKHGLPHRKDFFTGRAPKTHFSVSRANTISL